MPFTSSVRALLLAFSLFGLLHVPAHAVAPPAVIESVQMPVWIERAGVRQPLALGTVLQQSDRLITGPNARILLKLAEGSKVKLGENAQLNLDSISTEKDDKGSFFASALNVVRGAFRFTTDAAIKYTYRRRINVQFSTVTIGIRGTDVWGKQGADREIVCLIEGKVNVDRVLDGKATEPVTLDQPLLFYIAPKDKPTLPVATVAGEQLAQWAAETDTAAGAGVQSLGGKWQVTFTSSNDIYATFDIRDALRKQGYPVEMSPGRVAGKRVYHVRLTKLSSEEDARAIASRIGTAMNLKPMVGHSAI